MKLLINCLLVWLVFGDVQAEGLYLTLGAGKNEQFTNQDSKWNDADAVGAFVVITYKWNKQGWCYCYPSFNYAHLSQWDAHSGDNESSIDHIGISGTWEVFTR